MQTDLAQALRARRPQIRARWLELLFVEPVNTPLANPRSLIFMLDETLDAVIAATRRGPPPKRLASAECHCGRNPYLSYFRAGRQALFEALVLFQAEMPSLEPRERDAAVEQLNDALSRVSGEMIDAFGSLCQHRTLDGGCDHPDCDRLDGIAEPAGCRYDDSV